MAVRSLVPAVLTLMMASADIAPGRQVPVAPPPREKGPSAADIERMVARLGGPDFQDREAAQDELRVAGERALPHLVKSATTPNPEVARRVAGLLNALRPTACPLVRELKADPPFPIHGVRFSPDGKHLAAGGQFGVAVWEVETGRLVRQVRCNGEIDAVEFVPGEAALWAAGVWTRIDGKEKGGGGTVVRWDWGRGKAEMFAHRMWNTVEDVRLTPDGKHLLAAAGSHVYVLDTATGKRVHEVEVPSFRATRLAPAADGRRVAVGCVHGTIALVDYRTGRLDREWGIPGEEGKKKSARSHMSGAAYSPDGKTLATGIAGYSGGWVHLWNADGELVRHWRAFGAWVARVEFDPSGRFLVCGGTDNPNWQEDVRAVTVWAAGSGRLITEFRIVRNDRVADLAVSAPAGLFAVALGGEVRLHRFPHPAWGDLP